MNDYIAKLNEIKDYMTTNENDFIAVTISNAGISLLLGDEMYQTMKADKPERVIDDPDREAVERSFEIEGGRAYTYNRRETK